MIKQSLSEVAALTDVSNCAVKVNDIASADSWRDLFKGVQGNPALSHVKEKPLFQSEPGGSM